MLVERWMTPHPVCVAPSDTLGKAGALMASGGFRQLPVVANGKLVGIVTDRDLRHYGGNLESTQVAAAMTTCPVMVSPQDTAETAARLIIKHKVGALPVVENGAVVGIISTSDLLKAMLNVLEAAKQIIQR